MADKKEQAQSTGKRKQKFQVMSRIRIIAVDAAKNNDGQINGLELNVEMEDVKANGPYLESWFKYRVTYKPDVGHITMRGVLLLEIDEITSKNLEESYKANGFFESPWAENIANNINFKCATEAIFPAKIIDLPPPIMPPRISMSGQPEPAAKPEKIEPRHGDAAPAPEAKEPEKKAEKPKPKSPFGNVPFPPAGNPFTKQ